MTVVYFNASQSGATGEIANLIGQETGDRVVAIQVAAAYPADKEPLMAQAKQEQLATALPTILAPSVFDTWDTTLILCYPNWFNELPRPVVSWLLQNPPTGAAIFPVCLHEGSGMGKTETQLKQLCPGAVIRAGLPIRTARVASAKRAIDHWKQQLTVLKGAR